MDITLKVDVDVDKMKKKEKKGIFEKLKEELIKELNKSLNKRPERLLLVEVETNSFDLYFNYSTSSEATIKNVKYSLIRLPFKINSLTVFITKRITEVKEK